MLRTMVLENDLDAALIFEEAGVDRIFVDLEVNGKFDRQGHLDTVISDHSLKDIETLASHLNRSEILARVNPIYVDSETEIDNVINAGAKIVMLPMFTSKEEVEQFVGYVDGRAKTNLLLETSQAYCRVDDILTVEGIDEVHVGLNDLHLAMGLDFMFELLCGKLMESLVSKFKNYKIEFGIGGVAQLDEGTLKGKTIITEHARLGSTCVILSRAFKEMKGDSKDLKQQILDLKAYHLLAEKFTVGELTDNKRQLEEQVNLIAKQLRRI